MNVSSLRLRFIVATSVLVGMAWLSYGGQVTDGRLPYRAIPYEPGGFRPVTTEAPATDGPRATEWAGVASAPTPSPPPPARPTAQPQGIGVTAAATAHLGPTSRPASETPKPTPKPRLVIPAARVTPKPVTRPKPVTITSPRHVTPVPTVAAARAYARAQMSAEQFACLDRLWTKESHWSPTELYAPTGAYGIPQAVPGSKMASAGADWRTNPITQVRWGLGYIRARYGTPCRAWAHSQATNWY